VSPFPELPSFVPVAGGTLPPPSFPPPCDTPVTQTRALGLGGRRQPWRRRQSPARSSRKSRILIRAGTVPGIVIHLGETTGPDWYKFEVVVNVASGNRSGSAAPQRRFNSTGVVTTAPSSPWTSSRPRTALVEKTRYRRFPAAEQRLPHCFGFVESHPMHHDTKEFSQPAGAADRLSASGSLLEGRGPRAESRKLNSQRIS
jgi:hypothetical protein